MTYRTPEKELIFTLNAICDIEGLQKLGVFSEATEDMVSAIIEESGKQAADIAYPINRVGDIEGAKWNEGEVTTPKGFKEAYKQFCEAGWHGLNFSPELGGMGLPFSLNLAVLETWLSANLSLTLAMTLNQGAVLALLAHGSEKLINTYARNMIAGHWMGAMDLTEPHAGSNLGDIKTKATANDDGSWHIKGTKIFISWGEHDLAENIIHLVLAKTPGSAEGTKGISLFLVPKFLVDENGKLGERNDYICSSIEHKMGIHASPTCVMQFGDNEKCIGHLIGEEGQGMRNMFTMMNHARLTVGLHGVGVAEAACQKALEFATERVQGAAVGKDTPPPHTIINHPDVRRMIMSMKAYTEATRAICYLTGSSLDRAHNESDPEQRRLAQGRADLLTPIAKGLSTDMAVEVASLGVQVHGGMGFIEETGAAQLLRDARILPIYEGTNGIQALDLVGRKLNMDGGEHWKAMFREIGMFLETIPSGGLFGNSRECLSDGIITLNETTLKYLEMKANKRAYAGGATPYARMFGLVIGGYLLVKKAVAAQVMLDAGEGDKTFLESKISIARFYSENILPNALGLAGPSLSGDEGIFAISEDALLSE